MKKHEFDKIFGELKKHFPEESRPANVFDVYFDTFEYLTAGDFINICNRILAKYVNWKQVPSLNIFQTEAEEYVERQRRKAEAREAMIPKERIPGWLMHWQNAFLHLLLDIAADRTNNATPILKYNAQDGKDYSKPAYRDYNENLQLAVDLWLKYEEMAGKYGTGTAHYWTVEYYISRIADIDPNYADGVRKHLLVGVAEEIDHNPAGVVDEEDLPF